jgi:hypothetical protein
MVGMKPLERSLEKLDDVRKKKLIEMIGPGGDVAVSAGPGLAPSSTTEPNRNVALFVMLFFDAKYLKFLVVGNSPYS